MSHFGAPGIKKPRISFTPYSRIEGFANAFWIYERTLELSRNQRAVFGFVTTPLILYLRYAASPPVVQYRKSRRGFAELLALIPSVDQFAPNGTALFVDGIP